MRDMEMSGLERLSKRYVQEIEIINQFDDAFDDFYELETQLLHEIHHLEVEKAKAVLHEIIDRLSIRAGKETIRAVRRYYAILSSIMSRRLFDNQVSARKAFAFNTTCVDMVDTQMKDAEFLQFADDLIDFYASIISERNQPNFTHQTVNKVVTYIHDEIEKDFSVEELAQLFNVSTSHLSRIFKEHVGITLVEYLNVRRVEESQYYLRHTNKSISDIAAHYHFCNQSYFTRIFKKYVGLTPKQFRDQTNVPFYKYSL